MKLTTFKAYLPLLLFLTLIACSEDDPKDRLLVDVEDIDVSLVIKRLDADLSQADTLQVNAYYASMQEKYGDFWHDYISGILKLGHSKDPMAVDNFKLFFRRPYVADVISAVDSIYGGKDPFKQGLTDAFKHLKYYFPDDPVPTVVYSNNFFNYACVALDSVLNIGLDFYLGPEHKIVKMLPTNQFAEYIKRDMNPDYVIVDAMTVWFESHYLDNGHFETMLDAMVHYGKLMYALDAMMPEVPDYIKIKYTKDEMQWCRDNEANIWLTMVDRKLVHSTKTMDFKRYFEDAPFTAGLKGTEVPERIGVFIGWQIVSDYMAKNTELTLTELVNKTNTQKILTDYNQGKE